MNRPAYVLLWSLAAAAPAVRVSADVPATAPTTRPATVAAVGVLLAVSGEVEKPLELTANALARLPRAEVRTKDRGGKEVTYSGVPLRAILLEAGVPLGRHRMRGENLARYLVAGAADGYRAVFALPEMDGEFAERNILVADRKDGAPLDAKEGPLRIIVPGETLQARWVRQLTSLRVEVAPR